MGQHAALHSHNTRHTRHAATTATPSPSLSLPLSLTHSIAHSPHPCSPRLCARCAFLLRVAAVPCSVASSLQAFIAEVAHNEAESAAAAVGGWRAVAFALTYFAYSTWKGPCLYLEDIYVEPDWRGRGIGMALIERCVEFGHTNRCQRVMWQALDWNQPAIDFYVSLGATIMKDWLSLRLTKDAMDAFRRRYSTAANAETGSDSRTDKQQQQRQQVSETDMSTLS